MRQASLVVLSLLLCMLVSGRAVAQAPRPAQQHTSLLDYQKELGLTPDQVTKIQSQLKSVQDKVTVARTKDQQLQGDLRTLVQQNGPLPAIRAKLTERAMLAVDMQMTDLEVSRSISGIMTKDQLKKWEGIRAKFQAPAAAPPQH